METLFPKLSKELSLTKFSDIAIRFLDNHGFEAFECASEEEARRKFLNCYLKNSGLFIF